MYNVRKSKNQVTYPIEMAWAAVAAADRINHHEYVKNVQVNYSDDDNSIPEIVKEPNKVLAKRILNNQTLLIEEDNEFGIKLNEHYKGLLFRALGNNNNAVLNEFLSRVSEIVLKKEVNEYDIAVMCSLPCSYRREVMRESANERMATKAHLSKYIGQEGSKHLLKIVVEQVAYSNRYSSHIITAFNGDNIIKFFTSKDPQEFPVGTELTVKGTIKRNAINERFNSEETWLSRVAVIS